MAAQRAESVEAPTPVLPRPLHPLGSKLKASLDDRKSQSLGRTSQNRVFWTWKGHHAREIAAAADECSQHSSTEGEGLSSSHP